MEVIYPKSCSIDVHKRFNVAIIYISDSNKLKYIQKKFSTSNNQLIKFREQFFQNDCQNVCIETVSIISLYTMHWKDLSPMSLLPILNIKGEKDDNKNAKWIADLF